MPNQPMQAGRYVWEWLDGAGLECLTLEASAHGVQAKGVIVAELEGKVFKLRYSVACDAAWRFRSGSFEAWGGGARRSLLLAHETGGWSVDGSQRPDLSTCIDIDIMASPLTNTLPIRRLSFDPGETKRIAVAYIRVPDLSVSVAEQDYTKLDAAGRRFRYLSVESGFTAELIVDEDGVVIEYPNLWRRV